MCTLGICNLSLELEICQQKTPPQVLRTKNDTGKMLNLKEKKEIEPTCPPYSSSMSAQNNRLSNSLV